MPDPVDFSASPDPIWRRLAEAAEPSRPPLGFKSMALATIGLDGSPQARTFIVRSVDATARSIVFHTDRTSPKVAELRRDPRATLLGWDADARLQLRLTATISIHLDDAAADAFWASTSGLDVYRAERPSGATLNEPAEAGRATEPQRDRFALLVARVTAIEWLALGNPDQRRGRWTFAGDATHAWLVP